MSAGIDYGMGKTNIDTKTGIRYGVISQGSLGEAWLESAEADYGEPSCPKCGNGAENYTDFLEYQKKYGADTMVTWERNSKHEWDDFACINCELVFGSESAYGADPIGWYLDDIEYKATSCLGSDVMIQKSPYYTYAPFCSPCVPGAGNLDDAVSPDNEPLLQDGGVKTYAFGHDWFEDGKAPYVVYRVEDDSIVDPEVDA